ncbi:MAG: pentapeptide repeat-containing protein [Candidatus Aenigmarchaeota archaeon]|nr:pentapeptide repeat-containing protein [Candidatus Aenigmarchaeota archaeon]
MQKHVQMTGSEWMRKLFAGERDFSRTKIIGENIVLEHMQRINDYLTMSNLESEPLIFDLADISGVQAPHIYAPHTRARGVRALNVNFSYGFLSDSDFGPYKNPNGSDTRSRMAYATLDNAVMRNVKLNSAYVRGISLRYTDLSGSDMTGVKDLETSPTAGLAIYQGLIADEPVKQIIARKIGLGKQ